jgi:hypothetical protein
LKGVGKRTTPANAFALLFTAEHALAKLASVIDAWSAGDQCTNAFLNLPHAISSGQNGMNNLVANKMPTKKKSTPIQGTMRENHTPAKSVLHSSRRHARDRYRMHNLVEAQAIQGLRTIYWRG